MCNLTEYTNNHSKTSGILWQYYRDEPAINDTNGATVAFTVDNTITDSFKITQK